MRIAILDPSAGISGDMTLGALLDAGVKRSWLEALPARLGFPDVNVKIRTVDRSSVAATKVDFEIPHSEGDLPRDHWHEQGHDHAHGRHVGELIDIVRSAPVSDWVRERAIRAFELVGEAEGRVHGVEPSDVHLHEVGAVDAVLDIVGGVEGIEQLGVEAVYNLPVALGNGWVETAHGRLPIPAPATALLLDGVDVTAAGPVSGEATTPTGAALIRVLSAGPPPAHWRLCGVGWGAGTRDTENYPNTLRVLLAEAAVEAGTVQLIATDIDDLGPEYLEPLREALFAAGALDCVVWPTQGKKGRVAFRLEAQVPEGGESALLQALFAHSTSAGARSWTAVRTTLPRRHMEVYVAPSVAVRVKLFDGPNGPKLKPEYDDVLRAASVLNLPAHDVAGRAQNAALKLLNNEPQSEETSSE